MRPQPLDTEAVNRIAELAGIDSVAELARRSGIERRYLQKILTGNRAARPSHVLAIAAALEVERGAILTAPVEPAQVAS